MDNQFDIEKIIPELNEEETPVRKDLIQAEDSFKKVMEASESIYAKLQKARVLVQKNGLKKSGYNSFSKYHYHELADFIPYANDAFDNVGLCSIFKLNSEQRIAELLIVNSFNPEETISFTLPIPGKPAQPDTPQDPKAGNLTQQIQAIGAMSTYLKRYLYLNALEIVESDGIDATPS